MEQPAQQTVAIVVEDVSSRRLLETICKGLDLTPPTPTEDELTAEHSFDCEIIVVDRSLATKIRPRIGEQQKQREQVRPSLIAVTAGSEGPSAKDAEDGSFDAVLAFPYNVEVQTRYRSEQHIVCLASEFARSSPIS